VKTNTDTTRAASRTTLLISHLIQIMARPAARVIVTKRD
jgi:hypothetical protein